MEKFKRFADSAIAKVRNAKFAVGALTASAAAPIVAVVASADDETTTATGTSLAQYSGEIQGIFSGMVDQIMPIAIGILSTGAVIFGLFIAWKLAKKSIKSVTG